MWFEEVGEVVDMFRMSFPLSLLFFLPLCLIISPVGQAAAAQEFSVYRMQQYDLQGVPYGCRSSLVNVEARPIAASTVTRRCVVTKFSELTVDRFKEIIAQNAGGILILLQNLNQLSTDEQQYLAELEKDLVQIESPVPVYFTEETPELLDLYADLIASGSGDPAASATEALLSAASANGFQMVVSGSQSKAMNNFEMINIQGKLTGFGLEEQLPTIAIVAHYDAFGVAPGLAMGADSNASGVAALLELARLFSKLYTNSRTHAKFNMLFLLSAGGKFNYQGTKRWLEDQLDTTESSLLADVSYVMCIDSLASGADLNMHVSKPPKEGTAAHQLLMGLQSAAKTFFPKSQVNFVHKKINLADDFLSWEHERFSIRRLSAFTLSHMDSHKAKPRTTIMDTRNSVDMSTLTRNVKIMAEGLARHIFQLPVDEDSEIFSEAMQVEEGLLTAWVDYMSGQPRAAQLLDKQSPIVNTLEQTLGKYLKDVHQLPVKADKRDPEFVFYDGATYTMNAYSVKPAVFDLFLACCIAAYLAIVYFFLQHFSIVYGMIKRTIVPVKAKHK